MSKKPFLGVYETPEGNFIDLASGQSITRADIKPTLTPFYGVFLDKDGVEHRLDTMSPGGGASDHAMLTGREKTDQHPMSAVSGLLAMQANVNDIGLALDNKVASAEIRTILTMPQAEYDELPDKDANTLYLTY